MRRLPLLAALAILLLAAGGPARAAIYHWTDSGGTPHFSNRPEDVPPQYRGQLPPKLRAELEHPPAAPARSKAKPGFLSRILSAHHPKAAPERTSRPRPDAAKLASKMAFLRHLGVGGILAIALGMVVFSFLFYAFLIRLACRICGESVPSLGRAAAVVGVQFVAGIGLGILEAAVLGMAGGGLSPVVRGVNTLLGFSLNVWILRSMLGQTLGKALAVELVSIVISVALVVAIVLALLVGFGGMAFLHGAA